MANTAARLIGSYETIRVTEAAGVPIGRMICAAGGETVDLGNGVHAELLTFLSTEMSPAAVAHLVASAQGYSSRGDGGALVALLTPPEGSLLFQDTSGHWTGILGGIRPDVAIVAAAGRGNIDGQPIQGPLAEFVAREAELLQPRRMLLCHHDDWLPGFSVATDMTPIREALALRAPSTELIEPGYLAATEIFADLPPSFAAQTTGHH